MGDGDKPPSTRRREDFPSHLTKRKTDGAEISTIKKQRLVDYWLAQPHPVMLVIGTFSADDERASGKDKLEFAEVRWMGRTAGPQQRAKVAGANPEGRRSVARSQGRKTATPASR